MARLVRKILSVFVDNDHVSTQLFENDPARAPTGGARVPTPPAPPGDSRSAAPPGDLRFAAHFDKLFTDANIPGPDYYEFARMIVAMQVIPDERSRYAAAFAGLQAQGLDKEKLLTTAGEYLRVLGEDADAFQKTVEAALQEKVHRRSVEAEEKNRRIQTLSKEILGLQTQIGVMQKEIRESQEKLEGSRSAYAAESDTRQRQIQTDIEKINHYIQ